MVPSESQCATMSHNELQWTILNLSKAQGAKVNHNWPQWAKENHSDSEWGTMRFSESQWPTRSIAMSHNELQQATKSCDEPEWDKNRQGITVSHNGKQGAKMSQTHN